MSSPNYLFFRGFSAVRCHFYRMLLGRKLIPVDPVVCINFCYCMFQSAHDGTVYLVPFFS